MDTAYGEVGSLHIETEERPEGMVACVSGELDLANVNRFKDALQPALKNCRNIVLDVSKLRYIDSTGFHVLIDAHQVLQHANCLLVVVGASPAITKVMRILHMDKLMRLVSSVDEAVELIRPKYPKAASGGSDDL